MSLDLVLDAAASSLRVHTRATGMLARLAHDLELRAQELSGEAADDGGAWKAEIRVPVGGLRVSGTLRGERLDAQALSVSDRGEIERKIRAEVLPADQVVASVRGRTREVGDVEVVIGGHRARVRAPLSVRAEANGALRVGGDVELSLRALGIAEIKGPLGAFKVSDSVHVLFDLVLRPPPTSRA